MKHKKIFVLTCIAILTSSIVAWQIGRSVNAHRGSKATRFNKDCAIQALLRGKSNRKNFSLIPEEKTYNKRPHTSTNQLNSSSSSITTNNIEHIVEHR